MVSQEDAQKYIAFIEKAAEEIVEKLELPEAEGICMKLRFASSDLFKKHKAKGFTRYEGIEIPDKPYSEDYDTKSTIYHETTHHTQFSRLALNASLLSSDQRGEGILPDIKKFFEQRDKILRELGDQKRIDPDFLCLFDELLFEAYAYLGSFMCVGVDETVDPNDSQLVNLVKDITSSQISVLYKAFIMGKTRNPEDISNRLKISSKAHLEF